MDIDVGPLTDDAVLERELQQALKSEGEIELFKTVNKALRLRQELAKTEAVRTILAGMWEVVADFFETVTEADTLAGLGHDHKLVILHHKMRANFDCVAAMNATLKQGHEAEDELRAIDQMGHETDEDSEP